MHLTDTDGKVDEKDANAVFSQAVEFLTADSTISAGECERRLPSPTLLAEPRWPTFSRVICEGSSFLFSLAVHAHGASRFLRLRIPDRAPARLKCVPVCRGVLALSRSNPRQIRRDARWLGGGERTSTPDAGLAQAAEEGAAGEADAELHIQIQIQIQRS